MAAWLDSFCYPFDYAILEAIHSFAMATNGFFNTLMLLITSLANDGLGMIALGLVLLCFRRTRKVGCCVLGAIVIGALITNVTLKNLVSRPRPFANETRAFFAWWQEMGAHPESVNSFPSGHTTSAMAAMTAIFCTTKKKYSWTAFLFALLMGFTRMYFVVHYPTDVLAGLIAGGVGGVLSFLLVRLAFAWLEAHRERKWVAFLLDFDPVAALKHRRRKAE